MSKTRLTPGLRRLMKILGGEVDADYCVPTRTYGFYITTCGGADVIGSRRKETPELAMADLHAHVRKAAMAFLADEWEFRE